MRLSRRLVEIELSLGFDKLTLNKGRNWAFIIHRIRVMVQNMF